MLKDDYGLLTVHEYWDAFSASLHKPIQHQDGGDQTLWTTRRILGMGLPSPGEASAKTLADEEMDA